MKNELILPATYNEILLEFRVLKKETYVTHVQNAIQNSIQFLT